MLPVTSPVTFPHTSCVTALLTCRYNFNADEAVAILGAHTLGRANAADTGFEGPWVSSNNVLNNEYYTTLSDASLKWAQVKAPTNLGKIQWQRMTPDNRPLMMMNADMCLYKNLTLNATGGSKCTYATCPFTAGGSQAFCRMRQTTPNGEGVPLGRVCCCRSVVCVGCVLLFVAVLSVDDSDRFAWKPQRRFSSSSYPAQTQSSCTGSVCG